MPDRALKGLGGHETLLAESSVQKKKKTRTSKAQVCVHGNMKRTVTYDSQGNVGKRHPVTEVVILLCSQHETKEMNSIFLSLISLNEYC